MNLNLLGLLLAAGLASTGASANTIGCGGDAFSTAEVIDTRKAGKPGAARRGPVTAAPDSLCADLSEDRPSASPNIDVVIGGGSGQSGQGDTGQGMATSAPLPGRRPGR